MTLFLVLLMVVVLAGMGWLWYSQKKPNHRATLGRHSTAPLARPGGMDKLQKNPLFWGAEFCQAGCETARTLLGNQYPFNEVPELPLSGCDSAICTCQFKGLKDNRSRARRTHEDRRNGVRFDKEHPERRSRKNRRRGEKWDDHSY
jgi:hypothetical protein